MGLVTAHLKLLREGVGVVQLHDVLHKLLHRQRLVTVCKTSATFTSAPSPLWGSTWPSGATIVCVAVPVASSSGVDGADMTFGEAPSSG